MSILIGCINLKANAKTSPMEQLDRMLTRLDGKDCCTIVRHENSLSAAAQIDTGVFNAAGVYTDQEGNFTAVAGWPIVRFDENAPLTRTSDVELLHTAICADKADRFLRSCCGMFSLYHADRNRHRFIIASDRGGHRPLYYAHVGGQLFFSTMLKLLEAIPSATANVDLKGLIELVNLGYSLADRTPYNCIKLVPPGAYLVCQDGRIDLVHYYSWLDIQPFVGTREQALDELFRRFQQSVNDRTYPQHQQRSFLSGGLDSRAVVMSLCASGYPVQTVTFENAAYPDGQVAEDFSRAVGSSHHSVKVKLGTSDAELTANVFELCPQLNGEPTRLIFTGDGGSVGLGFVHFTEEICQSLNANDLHSVANSFLSRIPLVRRAFQPSIYEKIKGFTFEGVVSELLKLQNLSPLHRFYMFLLQNDQRRHLHYFFEQIDRCHCEVLAPFYDPRFLELVASCPVEWFLGHRFYHEWLTRFPPVITSIAWQTYPGHEPCPLPLEGGNQWQLNHFKRVAIGVPIAKAVLQEVRRGNLPVNLLRRWPIAICAVLQILRLADKSGTLRVASEFVRYTRSKGSS